MLRKWHRTLDRRAAVLTQKKRFKLPLCLFRTEGSRLSKPREMDGSLHQVLWQRQGVPPSYSVTAIHRFTAQLGGRTRLRRPQLRQRQSRTCAVCDKVVWGPVNLVAINQCLSACSCGGSEISCFQEGDVAVGSCQAGSCSGMTNSSMFVVPSCQPWGHLHKAALHVSTTRWARQKINYKHCLGASGSPQGLIQKLVSRASVDVTPI